MKPNFKGGARNWTYDYSNGMEAQLTTSLALTRGTGDATYTRATPATVEDNEGLINVVSSGETRFKGARRVKNLLSYSEDFSNAIWNSTNITKATAVLSATSNHGTLLQTYTADTGEYVFSVQLKRKTGTGSILITADDTEYTVAVLDSTWQRFYAVQTVAQGSRKAGIKIATSTDAIYIKEAQLERVTGRSNPNPSEYVSTNVLSTPFHGANVDGVKYFDYENYNINLITDPEDFTGDVMVATRSSSNPATYFGPDEYLADRSATNPATYYGDAEIRANRSATNPATYFGPDEYLANRSASNPTTYYDNLGVMHVLTTPNIPRYTYGYYNTTGFVADHSLLLENAATNYCLNSYFKLGTTSATSWSFPTSGGSPTNTLTASTINGISGARYQRTALTFTGIPNQYTTGLVTYASNNSFIVATEGSIYVKVSFFMRGDFSGLSALTKSSNNFFSFQGKDNASAAKETVGYTSFATMATNGLSTTVWKKFTVTGTVSHAETTKVSLNFLMWWHATAANRPQIGENYWFEIADVQIEKGTSTSTATSFIPTTTAAVTRNAEAYGNFMYTLTTANVPRYSYEPSGYTLLQEAAATNLHYNLTTGLFQMSYSVWTSDNTIIYPDGTTIGGYNTFNSVAGQRFFREENIANGTYTCSVYARLKPGSRITQINVKVCDRASDTVRGESGFITLTNDWIRVSATGTTSGASAGLRYQIYVNAWSTTNDTVYLSKSQIEVGALTSYIPTTTAAVTRNAETFSNLMYTLTTPNTHRYTYGYYTTSGFVSSYSLMQETAATNYCLNSYFKLGTTLASSWNSTFGTNTLVASTINGISGARYQRNIHTFTGSPSTQTYAIRQVTPAVFVAGDVVTISFYARGDFTGMNATAYASTGNRWINIYTHNGGAALSTIVARGIGLAATDGLSTTTWKRFNYTGTMPATATRLNVSFFITFAEATIASGDSYWMEIADVQFEKSASVTSFIPTVASAVTRNAELHGNLMYALTTTNTPRYTYGYYNTTGYVADYSLMQEAAATNIIPNSSMVGAGATTYPTGWGSDQSPTSCSMGVVGTGTDPLLNLPYVDIRYQGTAGNTNRFLLKMGTATMASGVNYTASYYIKLIAGTEPVNTFWAGKYYSDSIDGVAFVTLPLTGWRRITTTGKRATGGSIPLRFGSIANTIGVATDYTLRFIAPQIELGSTATSYIPTTTAAVTRNAETTNGITADRSATNPATYINGSGIIQLLTTANVQRYNYYNPFTFASGYSSIMENAATNLWTYSQAFDNAAWNGGGATRTADQAISPDGTMNADKIVADSAFARVNQAAFVVVDTDYFYLSCFLKNIDINIVLILYEGYGRAYFDLSLGIANTNSPYITNVKIIAYPNGWYWCSAKYTLPSGATSFQPKIWLGEYNGTNNAPKGCYIWGAMALKNTALCSYIPTASSASVTRNAETYTSAKWTKVNCTVVGDQITAPDGTLTADKITAITTNAYCRDKKTHNVIAGEVYNYSVYAKYNNMQYLTLVDSSFTSAVYATFNLISGTITTQVGVTATITVNLNGFYRCSMYYTIPSGKTITRPDIWLGTYNTTDNTLKSTYIWGSQLTKGATLYGYRENPTPIDARGTSISTKGVVLEKSAINLCTYSEQLDHANWGKGANVAVTANQVTAPDGTLTGDKVYAISTSGFTFIRQTRNVTSGETYTSSFFVKKGTWRYIGIRAYVNATALDHVVFDFDTLTFPFVPAEEVIDYGYETYTNGWYRVFVTATMSATATRFAGIAMSDATGSELPTITANSYFYVWGAQAEAGSHSTTYIPTTTAAVTRNTDILSYPSAGNIVSAVGALYSEITTEWTTSINAAKYPRFFDGTGGFMWIDSSTRRIKISDGADRDTGPVITGNITNIQKAGTNWGSSLINCYLNGNKGTELLFDDNMNIGANLYLGNRADGDRPLNGTIKNLKTWNYKLPNDMINGFTG